MSGEVLASMLTALLVAVVVALMMVESNVSCHRQWDQSGMNAEWRFFAGCMLQRADGTWIPAENYREIP